MFIKLASVTVFRPASGLRSGYRRTPNPGSRPLVTQGSTPSQQNHASEDHLEPGLDQAMVCDAACKAGPSDSEVGATPPGPGSALKGGTRAPFQALIAAFAPPSSSHACLTPPLPACRLYLHHTRPGMGNQERILSSRKHTGSGAYRILF